MAGPGALSGFSGRTAARRLGGSGSGLQMQGCAVRISGPRSKKNGPLARPVQSAMSSQAYWQTSIFRLSMYMPLGAGAVVLESVTARQRNCRS